MRTLGRDRTAVEEAINCSAGAMGTRGPNWAFVDVIVAAYWVEACSFHSDMMQMLKLALAT